jgi:hypothetical protein
VSILHQDDLLDPNYLGTIEVGLKRFPRARHAFAACRYIDSEGTVDQRREASEFYSSSSELLSGRDYAWRYLVGVWNNRHIHRCPGVTTSRLLLMQQCAYRKEAGHIADDDFFYRVGAYTDVVGISKPMASYREHASSVTGSLKMIDLVLARDYLFQIRRRKERAWMAQFQTEKIFEKLAVRTLNESLYYTLRNHGSEWNDVLCLADELELVSPGALDSYSPTWARPMWSMVRRGRVKFASLYVSLMKVPRGLKRRFRR